jgi:predicted metal-dependent HD superfamily phosphohydrolase
MTHLQNISKEKRQITDLHLETLLETLDRIHTAASNGTLADETNIDEYELKGWLEDIIYTAQETINELAANTDTKQNTALNIANLSVIRLYSRS